jgi:ribose transport system ATP-binding protein
MISLLGHNGAGKSTLIRIIAGLVAPSSGVIRFAGLRQERFGPRRALALGVRCVFQELSLCPSLTVFENTRVVHPGLGSLTWRRRSREMIRSALDTIFPGNDIDENAAVSGLTIGRRQMVEIARAFTVSDMPARLVILDEPTSALDATAADQLMRYTRNIRKDGCSCLFVSHRLQEIVDYTDDVVIMRDGRVTDRVAAGSGVSAAELVGRMGDVRAAAPSHVGAHRARSEAERVVDIPLTAGSIAFHAQKGEVVGLSGLAGQGQRELLLRMLAAARRPDRNCKIEGKVAYVAGDRQTEGVFSLWTIAENLSIGALSAISRFGVISLKREKALAEKWRATLAIRAPSVTHPIRMLSGGNQQKVLVARAFAGNPDVVLFDDPMRGVDVGTKNELYDYVRRLAEAGRTFIWYSTEIVELWNCDRVYILRNGRIAEEIARADLSEDRVIAASFERVQ